MFVCVCVCTCTHTFKCTACVPPGCIHSSVIPQPGGSMVMFASNVQNREKCFEQWPKHGQGEQEYLALSFQHWVPTPTLCWWEDIYWYRFYGKKFANVYQNFKCTCHMAQQFHWKKLYQIYDSHFSNIYKHGRLKTIQMSIHYGISVRWNTNAANKRIR